MNSRAPWPVRHAAQQRVTDEVIALILEQGAMPEQPWEAAELTYTFVLPDRRGRDADNLITGTVAITNAMKGRVFKDDRIACIGIPNFGYRYSTVSGIAATEVTVTRSEV